MKQYDLRNIKKTIVITFAGRSGSFLLHNLLDFHSQIISHPPDTLNKLNDIIFLLFHSYKVKGLIHNDKGSRTILKISNEELGPLIKKLMECIPQIFTDIISNPAPDAKTFLAYIKKSTSDMDGIQEENFKEKLSAIGVNRKLFFTIALKLLSDHHSRYLAISPSDIFSLVFLSYNLAQKTREIPESPVIVWQKHTGFNRFNYDVAVANTTIPDPIYITMVRRPHESIDSHCNYYLTTAEVPFEYREELYETLLDNFIEAIQRKVLIGPQYAIKFEDLHKHTEAIMGQLCKLSGIIQEPILNSTTLNGKPIGFCTNRKGKKETVIGVNKNLQSKKEFDVLSVDDISILQILLHKVYKKYGYEIARPVKPPILENCIIDIDKISIQRKNLVAAKFPDLITVASPEMPIKARLEQV